MLTKSKVEIFFFIRLSFNLFQLENVLDITSYVTKCHKNCNFLMKKKLKTSSKR